MLFLLSKKESSNLRGAVPAVLALQTSDQVGGPSLANLPPSCSQTLKGSLFLELPSLQGSSWESAEIVSTQFTSVYFVPDAVVGAKDTAVNQRHTALWEFSLKHPLGLKLR